MAYPEYDVEKNGATNVFSNGSDNDSGNEKRQSSVVNEDGAIPGESFEYGDTMYAKIQRLAGKMKMEQRGIERVPEDERTDTGFRSLLNVSTMVRMREA